MKSSKPTPSEFYGNPGIYSENNAAAKLARCLAKYTLIFFAMIVALSIMGTDQLNDQIKSAEVLSNTKYIASMDRASTDREYAAERAGINVVLATAGNEMPSSLHSVNVSDAPAIRAGE